MILKTITLVGIALIVSCKGRDEKLNITPPSFKGKQFTVTTRSGLNLRENAGVDSRSLGILPYNTKGSVLENQNTLLQIQNTAGYWLKVSTKGKAGWIFSGFVKLSDPQSAPASTASGTISALRRVEFYEPNEENGTKSVVKKDAKLGSFQVTAYNFPGHSMSYCLGTKYVDKLIIKDTRTGKTYAASDDHEELFALNQPLPNMVVSGISALCGCGEIFPSKFYFLGKSDAFYAYWPLTKTAMACGADGEYPGIEMRLEKSTGTLMIQEDSPVCNFDGKDDLRKPALKSRRYIVVMSQSGDFSSIAYDEKQMPPALAKSWTTSEPVNLNYEFAYRKDSKF